MTDTFVNSFTHLEDRYNAAQALHMLKRIASLVKPIMKKRAWVLPLLSEFFPNNSKLLGLNVNMGEQILLRLRPAHSPDDLLPEAAVVETMLHELTHNVCGPHDDAFYIYLSGLKDEYYALEQSGHDGDGFLSTGRMLVSSPYHDTLPPNVVRIKALEAAERRAKASRIISGGGRLGGPATKTDLSPRELAAQAAERRLRDDTACGTSVDVQGEVEKAKQQSIETKVNDLRLDKPDHSENTIVEDDRPPPELNATLNAAAGTLTQNTLEDVHLAPTLNGALVDTANSSKVAMLTGFQPSPVLKAIMNATAVTSDTATLKDRAQPPSEPRTPPSNATDTSKAQASKDVPPQPDATLADAMGPSTSKTLKDAHPPPEPKAALKPTARTSKADVHRPLKRKATLNATVITSKARTTQTTSESSLSRTTPALKTSGSTLPQASRSARAPPNKKSAYSTLQQSPPEGWGWPCSACAETNRAGALECEKCATPKPKVRLYEKDGWTCTACGEGSLSHGLWTCIWCGEVKVPS